MWWIKELQYSVLGKTLLFAVAGSIVAGAGFAGYKLLYNTSPTYEPKPVVAAESAAEAGIRKAKTGRELRCDAAIGRLQLLVDQTEKLSKANEAQRYNAFEAYANGARTCTYNDFVEFERNIVTPWASGVDVLTTTQEMENLGTTTETTE